MVSDGHAIVWLLAVLAALCPMGFYCSIGSVLVVVLPIIYIHWVEFQHTLPECLALMHVVRSNESCSCVGIEGAPLGDANQNTML